MPQKDIWHHLQTPTWCQMVPSCILCGEKITIWKSKLHYITNWSSKLRGTTKKVFFVAARHLAKGSPCWPHSEWCWCCLSTCPCILEKSGRPLISGDDSEQPLTPAQRQVWLSAAKVAKKLIAVRWKPPHSLSIPQWIQSLVDWLAMELSVARVGRAGENSIKTKIEAPEPAKALL